MYLMIEMGTNMNVFRKCLRKEFGDRYGLYVLLCQEELSKQEARQEIHLDSRAVYQDMYEHVRKLKKEEIVQRKENLMLTLVQAFQIGRQFWFVFFFYLMASLAIILMGLNSTVTSVSLVLMGICFLYKTYEFVCNKFCFVDAYLVMVYKTVLERASSQGV